jgi:nucleoside-diphosphate-sugar epimerase
LLAPVASSGLRLVESFLADGYDVIALSRRRPEVESTKPFTHSALDLRDDAACRDAAKRFGAVTHVVYTAVFELPGLVPGWSEKVQMDTNLAMLRNLMDPLSQSATGLKHVSLLQGTKAYGVHLHPIRIPARERFPRDPHENFYWLQEDYVRAKSARDGWAFTIWRPQLIVGPNYGVVMNLPPISGPSRRSVAKRVARLDSLVARRGCGKPSTRGSSLTHWCGERPLPTRRARRST